MFEEFFAKYDVQPPVHNTNIIKPKIIEHNPVSEQFSIPTRSTVDNISTDNDSSKTENFLESWRNPKTRAAQIVASNNQSSQQQNLKGTNDFEKAFEQALLENPNIAKYKNFLIKTAKRESGFNSSIQNKAGAPYYGYFQMGKDAIKSTLGNNVSIDEFRNNPVMQIKAAAKLYEQFLNQTKSNGSYQLAKSKGYSDDAIVSGAWLGGAGGVKTFITGKGNPSDSKWYGGKGGISVEQLMNGFDNYVV